MKNSLLIALLGLTVTVAVPSVASADSDRKFDPNKNYKSSQGQQKQKNRQAHKHNHRHNNKAVVKAKPRHQKPRNHNHRSKPTIKFAWTTVTPRVTHTNSHTHKNKHSTYKKPRYVSSFYERQDRQQQRIRKGVRSGKLVRSEAQQLRQEQHRIDRKIANYQRDGRLNSRERAKVHKKLDIAAKNIRSKMNNRITRYSKPRYQNDNRRYEYARR